MTRPELRAVANRIQAAWEAGRICSLAGRGLRARVVRAGRLLDAGVLPLAEAERISAEAENVAMAFAPLPQPPVESSDD
ncbi:hypothetical protein GU700_24380 [Methylobacterium sp. NI91]|nr:MULTISPECIES: hypothetical protein [unclassified Methylobacterium]QIJ77444.1 hypothetical protein CLZ_24385 [Methylobacterium sp. CLZ]QIJ82347.1 hypothetical protein GU700_24380 [Methylobacterium sp. NI91]